MDFVIFIVNCCANWNIIKHDVYNTLFHRSCNRKASLCYLQIDIFHCLIFQVDFIMGKYELPINH